MVGGTRMEPLELSDEETGFDSDELDNATTQLLIESVRDFVFEDLSEWVPGMLFWTPRMQRAILKMLGIKLQEPTALAECGEPATLLPQALVTLLSKRDSTDVCPRTTCTAMYLIWCSIANPSCPTVRHEQKMLYMSLDLVSVILNVLADPEQVFYPARCLITSRWGWIC